METVCICLFEVIKLCKPVNQDGFFQRRHTFEARLADGFASLNVLTAIGEWTPQEIRRLLKKSKFHVDVLLPKEPNGDRISCTGFVRIESSEENSFLDEIWKKLHGKISFTWHFNDFRGLPRVENMRYTMEKSSWHAENVEINRVQELRKDILGRPVFHHVYRSVKAIEDVPSLTIRLWQTNDPFIAAFSIFLNIEKSPYQVAVEKIHLSKIRRIVERSGPDLDIIATDWGTKVPLKCHRAILSMASEKLAKLLKMKEGESQLQIMEKLSPKGANALLTFIYKCDLSGVFDSVETAVEVLNAALEFEMFELVSRIHTFLKMTRNEYIRVQDALTLFKIIKTRQLDASKRIAGGGRAESGEKRDDKYGNIVSEAGTSVQTMVVWKRNVEYDDDDYGEENLPKRYCGELGLRLEYESSVGGKALTFAKLAPPQVFNVNADSCTGEIPSLFGPESIYRSYENYLELLEKKAVELIEWHMKEEGNAFIKNTGVYQVLKLEKNKSLRELNKVLGEVDLPDEIYSKNFMINKFMASLE